MVIGCEPIADNRTPEPTSNKVVTIIIKFRFNLTPHNSLVTPLK